MRKKLRNRVLVRSVMSEDQSSYFNYRFQLSAFRLVLLIILLVACNSKDQVHDHVDTYICPMHPTVIADKPGVCPVCAMDLVRKARPGEEVKITEDLAKLIKSPNEVVLASIKTMRPTYQSMPISLNLQGVVTYDTRNIYTISARVGGRLEKVLLKYNYQPVRKGQKVAEIYSPELVSAQQEFLYLIKNDPDNHAIIEASRNKLGLIGVSDQQIEELQRKQDVAYTFSIYSPYDGLVIAENQSVPSAPATGMLRPAANSGSMGMGGASGSATTSASVATVSASPFVREGSYVSSGQTLFRIVNLKSLWIEFTIPLNYANQIKIGDQLTWMNGTQMKESKIDFVEPFFDKGEDFIKVRSYYKGNDVSVGQLVEGKIQSTSVESLWIPYDALLDLGLNQIVFVKERGTFKPRKVQAGIRNMDWIQITQGMTSSDEFATHAQYLVDSENFIKTTY